MSCGTIFQATFSEGALCSSDNEKSEEEGRKEGRFARQNDKRQNSAVTSSGLLSLKPFPALNEDENTVWRMRRKTEASGA